MPNNKAGSAYVSVVPQVEGNPASIGDQIGSKLAGGMKGPFLAGAVAMGNILSDALKGAASAIGEQVANAFWNYADYEQLVGGVDKLFGDSSKKLQEYAASAYRTSGMSANQYMQQATGFSAALIKSLGGDTEKAADITDIAMRAMSDNVNTFGSNAEDVQNAIQGISRENYTMLDNLKLGYSGTKEGFKELIDDANAYAESIGEVGDMTYDSFADAIRAIDLIQQQQGIAGTTAKEAADTLEGSISSAQAAWDNFLTSFGTDSATVMESASQLYEALGDVGKNVGEYASTAAQNIFESIATAMGASQEDIQGFYDKFEQLGQKVFGNVVPYVEQAGKSFDALAKTCEPFTSNVAPVLMDVVSGLIDLFSAWVGAFALGASMFADAANEVINAAGDMLGGAGQAIDDLNNAVANGWQWLKSATSDAWAQIQAAPGNALRAAQGAVSSAMSAISGVVSGVWSTIQSVVGRAVGAVKSTIGGLSSIGGTVRGAFNAVLNAVKNPLESAKNFVRTAISNILGFFSGLGSRITSAIGSIHFPSPHISYSSIKVGPASIPIPNVSWYAQGGLVNGASLIGAGERGPELIWPSYNPYIGKYAKAIADNMPGGANVTITINGVESTDMVTALTREIERLKMTGVF